MYFLLGSFENKWFSLGMNEDEEATGTNEAKSVDTLWLNALEEIEVGESLSLEEFLLVDRCSS